MGKEVKRVGQMSIDGSQAGLVYSTGGYRRQYVQDATDTQSDILSQKISYCIDANYWKGTSVEDFFRKRRRQLVIEIWTDV